ncbi:MULTISPECIES: carotenoid biosynthesis protein [unclassified Polaribacter]|uniref:carotenoid biosynthesis protein n=1 Tax=unclassified Polaribacter TaxID=196858 RepID=UPI0011BE85F0|nr:MULTISPECIES: carotenoid biosynthesis protein [unclassified Polaribacter]TXD50364.1 carotenoid biosynthesis protein [Polaribacter sp. IC063]TXD56456.1 carotenoid biosynthesis protein [Polaribacter sp. IC066]
MIKNISTENRWIGLLILFYFFGLLGISFETYRDLFLICTPLNLWITLLVFYKVNKDSSKRFFLLSFLVFLIGFSVEAIGVATGVLFGNYAYGDPFGFKLFETPLMIGVNWLFLALSTYGIVQYFTKKAVWLILLPPVLMTSLDFLVEPVAMKLGFWGWENDIIPIQNYVMWFVTSVFIHGLVYLFRPTINTKVSFVIIGAQLIFFGVLNLVLK